jgi:hypothetical protein
MKVNRADSLQNFPLNSHSSARLVEFRPTHYLISRSKKVPVSLVPSARTFRIVTALEFEQGQEPAFELRAKQGFVCHGVPVIGYSLKPIDA